MIKLAIAGSRNFNDYVSFRLAVDKILAEWNNPNIEYIITGGAKGVDTLAERYAKERNIPLVSKLPNWQKYGKAAGPIRNSEIVADCTHLIAFPSHLGSGTQDTINKFKKNKGYINIKVLYID